MLDYTPGLLGSTFWQAEQRHFELRDDAAIVALGSVVLSNKKLQPIILFIDNDEKK